MELHYPRHGGATGAVWGGLGSLAQEDSVSELRHVLGSGPAGPWGQKREQKSPKVRGRAAVADVGTLKCPLLNAIRLLCGLAFLLLGLRAKVQVSERSGVICNFAFCVCVFPSSQP